MSIKDDLFTKAHTEKVAENTLNNTGKELPELTVIESKTNDIVTSSSPVTKSISESSPNQITSVANQFNFKKLFWVIYLIGVAVFFITFMIQFVMIVLRRTKLDYIQDMKFRIYEMNTETSPFSFLNWIFINPTMYEYETYDQILNHEKIHVSQVHYFDKLLAEFVVMVSWFNPFAWLLRSEITNNLEFLTDDTMLNKGTDRESYQINLLKVSVPQHALSLTTNYNQSILKTRIIMMNSKKSSARSSWKYLFILPLFGLSVISLNAVNQENQSLDASQIASSKESINIENNNQEETKQEGTQAKAQSDAQAQAQANSIENANGNQESKGDPKASHDPKRATKESMKKEMKLKEKAKLPFSDNFKNIDHSKVKPGFWQASVETSEVCFHLNNSFSENHGNWTMNECYLKSEIQNFNASKRGEFKITRDAGTLVLNGVFEDDYGHGKFNFEADASYMKFLQGLDVEDIDDKILFQLFISNATRPFITKVNNELGPLYKDDLMKIAIFINNDEKYEDLKKVYKMTGESVDLQRMVELGIHGVDKAYADEISRIAPDGFSLKELINCKIHGVDKRYVDSIKKYGFDNVGLKELISLKIHNVNMDEMKKIEKLGFGKLSIQEMINLSIHNVTPAFIKGMNDLGYGDESPEMIKNFAIHNVDKAHINSMRSLGIGDLSAQEMLNTRIHNLNAAKAKEIRSMGFEDLSFRSLMDFTIHNVGLEYVEGLRAEGFDDLGPKDFVNAKIHGITVRYIKDIRTLNLQGVDFNTIKKAKIHGVTPEYIKKLRSQGIKHGDLNDYIKHKIHF